MTQLELYTYARRLTNSNTTDWPESDLVIDLNDALSDVWTRIKVARGVLEFDDVNYTDLPSATFNLTANTASYKITADENSNEIITVHKVQVLNANNEWVDVPRKKVGEGNQDALLDISTDTAEVPDCYYEVGSTIYFSPIPKTTKTSGAKIWFDRAPKYFAVGGTTFEPGIPVVYHKLLSEKAALTYAISKGMNLAQNIARLVEMGELRLDEYESNRRDDERSMMRPESIDAR